LRLTSSTPVPFRLGEVEKIAAGKDAGVVDQDVDTAQVVAGRYHDRDGRSIGYTALHRSGSDAVILDGRDQGLGGCLVVQVIHHQISALMGEGQCDGSANPLLRSGY